MPSLPSPPQSKTKSRHSHTRTSSVSPAGSVIVSMGKTEVSNSTHRPSASLLRSLLISFPATLVLTIMFATGGVSQNNDVPDASMRAEVQRRKSLQTATPNYAIESFMGIEEPLRVDVSQRISQPQTFPHPLYGENSNNQENLDKCCTFYSGYDELPVHLFDPRHWRDSYWHGLGFAKAPLLAPMNYTGLHAVPTIGPILIDDDTLSGASTQRRLLDIGLDEALKKIKSMRKAHLLHPVQDHSSNKALVWGQSGNANSRDDIREDVDVNGKPLPTYNPAPLSLNESRELNAEINRLQKEQLPPLEFPTKIFPRNEEEAGVRAALVKQLSDKPVKTPRLEEYQMRENNAGYFRSSRGTPPMVDLPPKLKDASSIHPFYQEIMKLATAFAVYDANPLSDTTIPVYAVACVASDCHYLTHHIDRVFTLGVGYFVWFVNGPHKQFREVGRELHRRFPTRFLLMTGDTQVGAAGAWNRIIRPFYYDNKHPVPFIFMANMDLFPTLESCINYLQFVWKTIRTAPSPNNATLIKYHHYSLYCYTYSAWRLLGYFDESVFPAFAEDVEMAYRALSMGITFADYEARQDEFYHAKSSSTRDFRVGAMLLRWSRDNYIKQKWNVNMFSPGGWERANFTTLHKYPWGLRDVPHRNSFAVDPHHVKCIRTASGVYYPIGDECYWSANNVRFLRPNAEAVPLNLTALRNWNV